MKNTNTLSTFLGNTTDGDLLIDDNSFGNSKDYKDIYDNSLSNKMS